MKKVIAVIALALALSACTPSWYTGNPRNRVPLPIILHEEEEPVCQEIAGFTVCRGQFVHTAS